MNKEKSNYAFNAKLATLGIYIILIFIFLVLKLYLNILYATVIEIVMWISLSIQDQKITLLQEINEKIKNKHS